MQIKANDTCNIERIIKKAYCEHPVGQCLPEAGLIGHVVAAHVQLRDGDVLPQSLHQQPHIRSADTLTPGRSWKYHQKYVSSP